jgi:hypothetical protein
MWWLHLWWSDCNNTINILTRFPRVPPLIGHEDCSNLNRLQINLLPSLDCIMHFSFDPIILKNINQAMLFLEWWCHDLRLCIIQPLVWSCSFICRHLWFMSLYIKSIVTHTVKKHLNQATWGWIEASHPVKVSNHIGYFYFTFVKIVKFCKVCSTLCLAVATQEKR